MINNILFAVRLLSFLFFGFCLLFSSCKNFHKNSTHRDVSSRSIEQGRQLAKLYCQTCHQLPDPSLLDAKTWEKGVLPEMGPRLGIFKYGSQEYPRTLDAYIRSDFYPSMPMLKPEQWQNILDYYEATSPDALPPQKKKYAIKDALSVFTVEHPDFHYANPATTYVKIRSGDSLHTVIVADAFEENLYFFNSKLKVLDSLKTTGPVVDIDFEKNRWLLCNIGNLNPNNGKSGNGQFANINSKGKTEIDTTIAFDHLQRPVEIIPADINKDGKKDYLVCEFGNLKGALSWMENKGNNKFERHVIRELPGAVRAYVEDYNHDGLPDIWGLFAQGDEGISLFTNTGNGNFEERRLLQFPPSYGSSYFELDDFNKDGHLDILYTCGDNADYSVILKPYHGVYIFMNDGKNHFKQKFFYPINGCYKAMARDFDGDGDLDIATISFFADYIHQPDEGFVYLENKGNFDFYPYSLHETEIGRWLTMDAGDIDGDGKDDIILGNFSVGPAMMKNKVDWKKSPPFIILKNIGKSK
jgi:hypothetical protein